MTDQDTKADRVGGDTRADRVGGAAPTFPLRRTSPFVPPEGYRRLREKAPVSRVTLPTGRRAWIVTRYADVRSLLADPRISSDIRRPNFPAMGAGEQEAGARSRPFIRTDPPEHTRFRRMLQSEFTLRRARAMRPAIEAIVDRTTSDMLAAGPPADLVTAYANVISTATVLRLFALPADDVGFFRDVTRISGGRDSTAEEVSAALGRMFALLDQVVTEREQAPGDDLLSRLVVNHLGPGEISRQELLSTVGITIVAGRETTTSMIALGTLLLLQEPETLDRLRAEPDRMPAAVEELLRLFSVGDSLGLRVATEDIEVGGVTIPADDGVILLLGAANHDPDQFPDPGRFDPDRAPNHHLAFGFGIHQCLGASLARLELELALESLIRRVPGLRLAVPFDQVELRHEAATFGVDSLPVQW